VGHVDDVIAAHKNSLKDRRPDRRGPLISLWEQSQAGHGADAAVKAALQLVDGNANEVELAFYVLKSLAIVDPSRFSHLFELTEHRSAKVRQSLAFYIPCEFAPEVFRKLLEDKAASVRQKAIESIGMRSQKELLPELNVLRSNEKHEKVKQSLDYWIPLLEVGYRIEPDTSSSRMRITALTGRGIVSRTVDLMDPSDPQILSVVEELKHVL